jgi:hypothetical protein
VIELQDHQVFLATVNAWMGCEVLNEFLPVTYARLIVIAPSPGQVLILVILIVLLPVGAVIFTLTLRII